MHDRLVGVPPPASVLDAMEALIAAGDPLAAADLAMVHPLFYSSALKSFATPWTNVDRSVFEPLNDYTATVIGIVRDDRPFTDVLSADLVYVGAPGVVGVGYSHANNDHYEQLELTRADLSDPAVLIPVAQSTLGGAQIPSASTAGVLTTRAAGAAYLTAGTNRRMWRFIGIDFMCRDMEALNDITRPSDRVRQDVSRSPGGDSRIFHNACVGCHSGMDALAGAFAYFNFDESAGRVVYSAGAVQPKYLINANTFPYGYVTVDDRWDNYWRAGPNSALGWRAAQSGGNGPKGLGQEVALSRAFSVCQVQKVFERVCLHPPQTAAELAEVERVADVFEAQNHSLRRVFAELAGFCMGM